MEFYIVNQYAPAPAGTIECEVVAASIGEVAWKASPDNERGACLRLRLRPAGNYQFIFNDVPLDWGRMLDAVAASLGIDREELVPGNLVGKRAKVAVKHFTARDGTTKACVAKWLPAPVDDATSDAPPAPAKSEPRKAAAAPVKVSRNSPPQYGDDDDIPF